MATLAASDLVVAELAAAPLDLDVLAGLVAIALVAAVVAELAAELVAAPLDLDVLAALVAIALVAAVVAELAAELVAAPLDLDVLAALVAHRAGGRGGRRARGGGGGRARGRGAQLAAVVDLVVAELSSHRGWSPIAAAAALASPAQLGARARPRRLDIPARSWARGASCPR